MTRHKYARLDTEKRARLVRTRKIPRHRHVGVHTIYLCLVVLTVGAERATATKVGVMSDAPSTTADILDLSGSSTGSLTGTGLVDIAFSPATGVLYGIDNSTNEVVDNVSGSLFSATAFNNAKITVSHTGDIAVLPDAPGDTVSLFDSLGSPLGFWTPLTNGQLRDIAYDPVSGELFGVENTQDKVFRDQGSAFAVPGGVFNNARIGVSPTGDIAVLPDAPGDTVSLFDSLGSPLGFWTPLANGELRDIAYHPGSSELFGVEDTQNKVFRDMGSPFTVPGGVFNNARLSVVPEPSTVILAAIGLVGLAAFGWRRRRVLLSRATLPHCTALGAAVAVAPLSAGAVTIPTVPVANDGNLNDTTGFGAVAYDYRIGAHEVTNTQYAEFLNAKAASDPLALYNTSMGSGFGGITRSGSAGSYTYAVIAGRGDKPVNYVSWYDSIRFANWLHNGQGTADTETGAYTLMGGTPTPTNGSSIVRNAGAVWFLTSEDEWYKAAYYANDGQLDSYWDYPTQSNTAPTSEAPPGGSNSANYSNAVSDLTEVGAYVGSDSAYGTFDQGGNLWEWNEAPISGGHRGLRGGSNFNPSSNLLASHRFNNFPANESIIFGFRVATVPEPSTLVLAGVAALGLLLVGWRRLVRLSRTAHPLCAALVVFGAAGGFAPTKRQDFQKPPASSLSSPASSGVAENVS